MDSIDSELYQLQQQMAALHAAQQHIQARMDSLLKEKQRTERTPPAAVKTASPFYSSQDKIALFRRLFRGRTDVYPKRFESRKTGRSGYQPACANEWKNGLCDKPSIKCSQCAHREFLPVTDDVIGKHLRGQDERGNDFIIGVYPMLENEHCLFLAVDFDKKNYVEDVQAFLETCRRYCVPAALERSRSGNGAHVWIFFTETVSAHIARQMGSFLLTETMENRPELGFESYDRFFPNQDTMPSGGLGYLIALPLQAKPRKRENSVFLDEHFQPYSDQWSFLANLTLMTPSMVEALAAKAVQTGRVTAVKMPELEENEKPWEQPPSRKHKPQALDTGLKQTVEIVIENEIYFTKSQLTPKLQTALLRLAAAIKIPYTEPVPVLLLSAGKWRNPTVFHLVPLRLDKNMELLNGRMSRQSHIDPAATASTNGRLCDGREPLGFQMLASFSSLFLICSPIAKILIRIYTQSKCFSTIPLS